MYQTLADLVEARMAGKLPGMALVLDNDSADMMDADGEYVFSMHPRELLEQALDLLGIRRESVLGCSWPSPP